MKTEVDKYRQKYGLNIKPKLFLCGVMQRFLHFFTNLFDIHLMLLVWESENSKHEYYECVVCGKRKVIIAPLDFTDKVDEQWLKDGKIKLLPNN